MCVYIYIYIHTCSVVVLLTYCWLVAFVFDPRLQQEHVLGQSLLVANGHLLVDRGGVLHVPLGLIVTITIMARLACISNSSSNSSSSSNMCSNSYNSSSNNSNDNLIILACAARPRPSPSWRRPAFGFRVLGLSVLGFSAMHICIYIYIYIYIHSITNNIM